MHCKRNHVPCYAVDQQTRKFVKPQLRPTKENQKHTGYAAIENVNTIDERRSKSVRNNFRLPFVATNSNRKHCFERSLIRVRRLSRAFSIVAIRCENGKRLSYIERKKQWRCCAAGNVSF